MIRATGLSKNFGAVCAVKDLNFEVRRGEIFGLIGPNGAGKTTNARLLSGILKPTSGDARIGGFSLAKNMQEIRKILGVVPEGTPLYRRLTAFETIRFFGQVHGVVEPDLTRGIEELAEKLQFEEHLHRANEGLSLGTKKKVLFASALLHNPAVLICDEPTLGLDPRARQSITEILLGLKDAGKTVLVTSHNMEMMDRVCDDIAVIHKGQLRIQGPPAQIKQELAETLAQKEVNLDQVFLHYTA